MELFLILLKQIAIMALLAAVGVYLSRAGFLSAQGTKDLGAILLRVVIPCVIVKSYITQFSRERLVQLALSAGLALLGFVLAMAIAYLAYGKRRRIENFAAAFCNAGFIGIPLAQAVIGEEGVFFVAATVALLNLFQWTYGVYIMTDRRDAISLKAIAKNPVVIAIVLGVALYLSRLPVPSIITSTLGYIAMPMDEHPCGDDPHWDVPGQAAPVQAAGPSGVQLCAAPPDSHSRRPAAGLLGLAHLRLPGGYGGLPGGGHPCGGQYLRVRPAVRLRL